MTRKLGLFLLLGAGLATPQKPMVYENGVVNAATFGVAGEPADAVAPGSIASVFGENLATTTAAADELPLPRELAGTSVTIGGVQAPLFFVSPGQLNLQVPNGDCSFSFPADPLVVTTAGGESEPVEVVIDRPAHGVFTLDFSGCGQAAILNVASDGSVSLNGPENPVSPGEFISIFGTGLGCLAGSPDDTLFPTPPDGEPAPPNARATRSGRSMAIDRQSSFPSFAGRAPGLVGVDQYNVQIPEDAREGCATPLEVEFASSSPVRSQTVSLSIKRGDGACSDPSPNSLGLIKWKRTFLFSEEGSSETEELRVRLVRNRNATLRFDPPFERPPLDPNVALNTTPLESYRPFSCPQFQDQGLDAGTLAVEGPGFGPIEVAPAVDSAGFRYRVELPEGAIAGGTYRVSASGGADVGAFETTVEMAPPIDVTTNVPPGTVIPNSGVVRAEWTGGQVGSVVRLKVVTRVGTNFPRAWQTGVDAAEGNVLFAFGRFGANGAAEVSVFLEPENFSSFEAEGLTLGAQHVWEYEYRFTDLRVQ